MSGANRAAVNYRAGLKTNTIHEPNGKPHETDALIRVYSWDFVDRFTLSELTTFSNLVVCQDSGIELVDRESGNGPRSGDREFPSQ